MRRNFALTEEVYPSRTRDLVKSLHTQGSSSAANFHASIASLKIVLIAALDCNSAKIAP